MELFLVANFSATRLLTPNAESNRSRRFAFYANPGNDLRRRSPGREFSAYRTRALRRPLPPAPPAETLALSV